MGEQKGSNPELDRLTEPSISEEFFKKLHETEFEINAAALYMDKMTLFRYFAEVIDELQAECPFMHETVYIRGNARLPQEYADEEDQQFEGGTVALLERKDDYAEEVTEAFVEGLYGSYRGLGISEKKDEAGKKRYVIEHAIHLGSDSETKAKNTLVVHYEYVGHFASDSQIFISDELDEAFYGEQFDAVFDEAQIEQLIKLSGKLINMLSSRSFLELEASNKKHAYEAVMEEVKTYNGIVGRMVNVQLRNNTKGRRKRAIPPVMYVPAFDSNGELVYEQVDLATEGVQEITGTCFGVVSLEDINISEEQLKNPKSLIDRSAGLCLAIDPGYFGEEEDYQEGDGEGQAPKLLYLPLGKGNNIKRVQVLSDEDLVDLY